MELVTEQVLVVNYGEWEIDGEPVKRKDGSPAEYVTLLDPETGEGYQWTLAESVNGERPKPLAPCRARVQLRMQATDRGMKLKPRVLGFVKAQ
jgi:hypothetical protein